MGDCGPGKWLGPQVSTLQLPHPRAAPPHRHNLTLPHARKQWAKHKCAPALAPRFAPVTCPYRLQNPTILSAHEHTCHPVPQASSATRNTRPNSYTIKPASRYHSWPSPPLAVASCPYMRLECQPARRGTIQQVASVATSTATATAAAHCYRTATAEVSIVTVVVRLLRRPI